MRGQGARVRIKSIPEQDRTLAKLERNAKRHDSKRGKKSEAQLIIEALLNELVPDRWIAEFKFHSGRRWRFDYLADVWAIEIEGGIWTQGRHTRGAGFQNDLCKYNEAQILGYKVLRFSTQDVLRGRAAEMLRRVL